MPYTLKPNDNVTCQCGAIINKHYVQKHLQTAQHDWPRKYYTYVWMYGCMDVRKYYYVYIHNITYII